MSNDYKIIPLTQGRVAIVDAEDYDWLIAIGKWHYTCRSGRRHGYARKSSISNGKHQWLRMHVAILQHHNLWLPGRTTDHYNGCGLDNRKFNLRLATVSENGRNRRRQRNNSSGATGVGQNKYGKWWAYYFKTDESRKRRVPLYYGDSKKEAIAARRKAEKEIFGPFQSYAAPPPLVHLCPDCSLIFKEDKCHSTT